jgi:hypothetical protein
MSELWEFTKAVVGHWGSFLTSGALIAAVWLFEHYMGESMPRLFAGLLAAAALAFSMFSAWRDQYRGWAAERQYRSRVADDLAELRHAGQKRYYEWWENCMGIEAAARAKAAAEELRQTVVAKLQKEISAAEADYFNTPRMFEPFPSNRNLVACPEGALINEFGYRIQRLSDVIQRVLDRGRKEHGL